MHLLLASVEDHQKIKIRKSIDGDQAMRGDNVTFTCESNQPIHWVDVYAEFPLLWTTIFAWDPDARTYLEAAKLIEGKFQTHHNQSDNLYIDTLDLYNVDHRSVGQYYCITNSTTLTEPKYLLKRIRTSLEKVYLYVKGEISRHLQWTE